jgi:hypothetical protein
MIAVLLLAWVALPAVLLPLGSDYVSGTQSQRWQ